MPGLKRIAAIFGGIILILGGIALIFLPGPGLVLIAGGVFLISPYHGKRIWKRLKKWKKEKLDPRLKRFRSK